MLDLESEVVREHWRQAAPGLAELFDRIHLTEDWTLDGSPEIAAKIVRLGLSLSQPGAADALEGADRHRLLFFLVYISTSKAIRLLEWLDEHHGQLGSAMLESLLRADGQHIRAGIHSEQLTKTLVHRLRILRNQPYFRTLLDPLKIDRISAAIRLHQEENHNA
ncbi:type IVB secretion system protein IcmW [Xanthomonas euvesicatoria]